MFLSTLVMMNLSTFVTVTIVVLALIQIPVYGALYVLNAMLENRNSAAYREQMEDLQDYMKNDGDSQKEENSLGADDFIFYKFNPN